MWSSGWYYGCGWGFGGCAGYGGCGIPIRYCASGCGVTPYYYPCGPCGWNGGCGY
jgi:hypothetical protein